jgi:ribosomal-protein-alanine N-acetyltransferase
VSKNLRRKQIGKLLINHLLANFAQAGSAVVWLEVRESNISAIDFYKSNSFTFCYKRRNFYTNPNENAIIMKLETESSKNWKK